MCWSLKDIYTLVLNACPSVTLHGKRDFTDGIDTGRDPGLSGEARCCHGVLILEARRVRGEVRGRWAGGHRDWGDGLRRWKKGPQAEECRHLLEAGKGKGTESPCGFHLVRPL